MDKAIEAAARGLAVAKARWTAGDQWTEEMAQMYQRHPATMFQAQAAIEAYEAARWQPIETAPEACHVLAARIVDETGDWCMAVVLSPPSKPFTHWMPLPAAPAAMIAARPKVDQTDRSA